MSIQVIDSEDLSIQVIDTKTGKDLSIQVIDTETGEDLSVQVNRYRTSLRFVSVGHRYRDR